MAGHVVCKSVDGCFVCNVDDLGDSLDVELAKFAQDIVQGQLVATADRDRRGFAGKRKRGCPSNATIATGDDDDASGPVWR